jgi:CheY-like chemotaxis protein
MSIRSPQASSSSTSSASSTVPGNAHIPVLLVNDEPSLRVLKRSLLREAGYEVRAEPADGVVALEYLRSSDEPLIVIFNTRMPRLDGTAFLRAVARDPELQRHAYVLNTALAGMLPNELAPLVRRLGVPVVGKPFSIEDLLGAVAMAESRVLAKATAAANR